MWKALLKKQFLELLYFYFPKGKPGKKRGTGAVVGFLVLSKIQLTTANIVQQDGIIYV